MSDWQDIKTLPRSVMEIPSGGVLLWGPSEGKHFLDRFKANSDWWRHALDNPEEMIYPVFTHWTLTPEPPSDERVFAMLESPPTERTMDALFVEQLGAVKGEFLGVKWTK